MKKTALLVLLLALTRLVNAQQYQIKAHVTGFANGTKFYLEDTDVDANIDSAVIKDNEFVMQGKLAYTPQSLWLYATAAQKYYYVVLFMGNDKINIKGDIKDFPFDLSVTGSKTHDEYRVLTEQTKAGYKKRNELVAEYFALKGDSAKIKAKQIWKVIGKIDSTDDAIRKGFIKTHLNSYAGLHELFYLKNKYPKDTLQRMYSSLSPTFKQSYLGQRIGTYLKVGDILKKGDKMADFEALDKSGRKHRLSDIKGKYVLLDFSTTYCGPCMQSLEDLKLVTKKYGDQLEVITFSGDGGKDTWLKGLNRDNPTWLSVWDGKGSYGETIMKYGVTGYPSFVLINPEGNIVSKWSGYGKEPGSKGSLETEMEKLMATK